MNIAKYTKFPLYITIFLTLLLSMGCGNEQEQENAPVDEAVMENPDRQGINAVSARKARVVTGPENLISNHLSLLEGKRVGVVANHTALVFGANHLVDTLLASGVNVTAVFAPEHGFRGTADAGEHVESGVDKRTRLPIISLYGDNRKPTPDQMKDVDLIIFDIQDIGSRHYTYIGTMTYVMEACAENDKDFMVLDRPNPNGWYVDGPVLEKGNNSFIGMHEVPIVHGMTIGEYAEMVNEEGWMEKGVKAKLSVIPSKGYIHKMSWEETGLTWVAPSPNIGTEYASYLYPAICWFEPTPVSLGRGTDDAFTIIGTPWFQYGEATARTGEEVDFYGLKVKKYSFTPVSLPGKSKNPKFQNQECKGWVFQNRVDGKELFLAGLYLLSDLYGQYQKEIGGSNFFFKGFNRWPGNTTLQEDIAAGKSPEEIYESWRADIAAFKEIRTKYLLYPDFE